mgnify:FL=1
MNDLKKQSSDYFYRSTPIDLSLSSLNRRFKYHLFMILSMVLMRAVIAEDTKLHDGFIYLDTVITDVKQELMYASKNNFTGKVVDGYEKNRAILTIEAAGALKKVDDELKMEGYGLVICDAYRPKRAVSSFMKWRQDPDNHEIKKKYYPDHDKQSLFRRPNRYIAPAYSSHSRGSTVDLTLYDLKTKNRVDMGTNVDFFGSLSHTDNKNISDQAQKNRKILKEAMKKYGFKNYPKEWWHYTLVSEPFPNNYFDFPVK